MNKRSILFIIIIVVVLVLVKVLFLKPESTDAPKPGAAGKNMPANVTGYVVHPQSLQNELYSSGTIIANEEVSLRPEVSGKLIAVYFKEGSMVQKGALLAKINDADLQAQLRKLQLQANLSRDREARLKGLLDIKGVSQDEYETGANEAKTIGADIDYTRAQIAKTEIRAPFSGKIGLKQISEGNFVSPTDVIAAIQKTDELKLDFTVPEKYANMVKIGDEVLFTVENQKGDFKATVYAVEPAIDRQTRNVMVRALYNNRTGNMLPGSFAKVKLVMSNIEDALMVPTEAVIPELKGKKVFVVRGGKAVSVPVETGLRNDAAIQILSGLSSGDTVITTGIMSLKPDAPVKLVQLKP
ncbi:MAG: efflux RND transporter periplasmic adaptor subunit [Chitinophagaceae bacterium]